MLRQPRVHKELAARGKTCSENIVAKLMRAQGLAAQTRRKYQATTDSSHSLPLAENVLNREFERDAADRVWLGDITCVWTLEGWLYLAAVLDTYSRKIVGWSMSHRMEKSLVMNALRMALGRRCPDQTACLLHHSDRGSQYASGAFQDLLREYNITCSMGDNAMMESFFATLKKERIYHESYATRPAARQSVFEYIELSGDAEKNKTIAHEISAREQATRGESPTRPIAGIRYSGWRDAFERHACRSPAPDSHNRLTSRTNP